MRRFNLRYEPPEPPSPHYHHHHQLQHRDDTLRLRLHIDHLKKELANARSQVEHLMQSSHDRSERLWPEPDYPEATTYYNCSSQEDVQGLIKRFSNLFYQEKDSLMETLNELPEFGEAKKENEEANMLEVALYRHMYRRAKSQHGMSNAKEVTAQIWNTLYDFPSLKTCTKFNRFILECVDVCWDLVAGIDGRYPRLATENTCMLRMGLDFEAHVFDPEKHQRFEGSDPSSALIKSVLWPGLLDENTEKVLLRAVVQT